MPSATAWDIRRTFENEGRMKAAQMIDRACQSEEQAVGLISLYGQSLLTAGRFAAAGHLYWGDKIFSLRPECSQRVFTAIRSNAKTLIMGGGSVGKSYTGIGWTLLDWAADPQYTTVKLISTTGGHSRSNTFATMKNLHEQAIVPLPGYVRSEAIQYRIGDDRACISIVRVKEGMDSSGVLQGFHPLPRPSAHPIFGDASRVRAVLDEAEEISPGVWGGVDNMQTSLHGTETVKIYAFYNPKDISGKLAQLAEPPGGWGDFDVETGYRGKDEWISKQGWKFIRTDPAKTENVRTRTVVHIGLQTYEGFEALRSYNGGNSINYYVFGRGCYPPDGAVNTIVSQAIIKNMRGEFIFSGKTIKVGSADVAVDGRDELVYTVGRYGLARAFRRFVTHEDGTHEFVLETFKKERWVLQIDQQFSLKKGSTQIAAEEIKKKSIELGVAPGWLMIDATGNGAAVLGLLRTESFWSNEVRGVDFSEAATEKKILDEDVWKASEQFKGVHTEVWFAMARWGEYGFLAISPSVNSESLESQIAGRRYILDAGKLVKAEDKDIFKARINRSPDHGDSATLLLHCVRMKEGTSASMVGETNVTPPEDDIFRPPDVQDTSWLEG